MLAIMEFPAERLRRILALCSGSKAKFKIIPASFTQMDQRMNAAMLHDLSPEDLLPRVQVDFDQAEIRGKIRGRRILITGGAGSIGSEIARQVAANECAKLVLVDVDENNLYLNARRLQADHPDLIVRAEVADIREPDRLMRLGKRYRPEIIFHAAAHKHVPLMEDAPEEAVKNNVFGTQNVARMADAVGAERLVLISTDKAVRPSSVMGATKRIAEMVVRDVGRRSKTRMTAVRFGNVLGSAGSVIPIFKQQIRAGRAGDGHAPGVHALLHDHPGGGGAGAGVGAQRLRRALHPGDGGAGAHRRPGPPPHHHGRLRAQPRDPHRLHRPAPRREAPRGAHDRGGGADAAGPQPHPGGREPVAPGRPSRRLAELRKLADVGEPVALLRAMRELVPSYRTPETDTAATAAMSLPPGASLGRGPDAFDQDGTQPPSFPVPPGRA